MSFRTRIVVGSSFVTVPNTDSVVKEHERENEVESTFLKVHLIAILEKRF
jgi:hypothetical protein